MIVSRLMDKVPRVTDFNRINVLQQTSCFMTRVTKNSIMDGVFKLGIQRVVLGD